MSKPKAKAKPKLKPKLKPQAKAAPARETKSRGIENKSIMESAQHIWLAGLGAFGKAQEEGSKLFEGWYAKVRASSRRPARSPPAPPAICAARSRPA